MQEGKQKATILSADSEKAVALSSNTAKGWTDGHKIKDRKPHSFYLGRE